MKLDGSALPAQRLTPSKLLKIVTLFQLMMPAGNMGEKFVSDVPDGQALLDMALAVD